MSDSEDDSAALISDGTDAAALGREISAVDSRCLGSRTRDDSPSLRFSETMPDIGVIDSSYSADEMRRPVRKSKTCCYLGRRRAAMCNPPHTYNDELPDNDRTIINGGPNDGNVAPKSGIVASDYRRPVVATSDWSGGCSSAGVPFRILVVDDDTLIHFILSKALSKAGMSVSCLTSAREALMVLEEAYDHDNHTHTDFPDAIIIDLDLSSALNDDRSCEMNRKVFSGIDTAREIRRRFPRCAMTPIIAYTAETNVLEILPRLLDCGFSDYASKQSTTADLLARIYVQTKAVATQRALKMLESRDAILRDILPSEVVSQLITGTGEVEPQSLGDVTILFADIVGFTTLSAKLDTTIMIGMLHSLFSAFDRLAEAHGAFKVETIGDCYMCVTGHDKKTKEAHARLMVHMGLAMVEAARDTLLPDGESVCIRVGIHTGSAHAGVVGLSRPRYCLFGDTVNVASRMESTSKPGQVHVSEATYASCVSQVMPQSFKHALNRVRMDLLNRDVSSGNANTPADISAGLAMNCDNDNDNNPLEFTSPLSQEIKGKGLMVTRFCKPAMPTQ